MFLPVLLVRDYGVWGWVVFAVPNVIGAAAMGLVLRSEEQSRRMVEAHRTATATFSAVTVLFHIFFIGWMLHRMLPPQLLTVMMVVLAVCTIGIAAAGWLSPRLDLPMGILPLVLSLALFMLWLSRFGNTSGQLPATLRRSPLELCMFAPICVFGFALCPYLDRTFHRARQMNDRRAARIAFGIGFGLFFLAMIVFTLCYSGAAATLVYPLKRQPLDSMYVLIAGHIIFQTSFTVGIHARELARMNSWRIPAACGLAAVLLAASFVHDRTAEVLPRWPRMELGELIYRCFMAFYGLVFPAYAWICMLPTWRNPQPPARRQLIVFVIAVLLAAPMYWLGFIEQKTIWLLPGLWAVLIAPLVLRIGRTVENES